MATTGTAALGPEVKPLYPLKKKPVKKKATSKKKGRKTKRG